MAVYIKQDEFISIALEQNCDPHAIVNYIKNELNAEYATHACRVRDRIANYRRKGLLPLESGNSVEHGTFLKGTSSLYDNEGNLIQQWVKTDVTKEQKLIDLQLAVADIAKEIPTLPLIMQEFRENIESYMTVYISNDLHFGMLAWEPETGQDWDTNKTIKTVTAAYDELFAQAPDSKVGVIVDLGDMTEADDFTNSTPKSGNPLDTDSRYPKVLRAAYSTLIYAVNKALQKHELVYFYNIAGNHDIVTGHAVREIIYQAFKDNPRVIVDESCSPIKYHQHGQVLLQFFHGDQMKMNKAGEVMAYDCQDIFSDTKHRYSHAGHNHRDAVHDGPITKVESHRNLPPTNAWAHGHGYRRGIGTMKAITYDSTSGEKSRVLFSVDQTTE